MAHAERGHVELSPSSASRWMACPGSVQLSRGMPRGVVSEFAREGTAAHELAELCLKREIKPSQLLGRTISGFEVTEDMASAVEVYVNYCSDVRAGAVNHWLEAAVSLGPLNPPAPMGGTTDFAALLPMADDFLMLEVVDYKHGKGVLVSPEENPQGMYYALATLVSLRPELQRRVRAVRITIIQPRAVNVTGYGIRSWECDPGDLHMFTAELFLAAAAALAPNAPLKAGDHCRFCPALPACPQVAQNALAAAQATFADGVGPAPTEAVQQLVQIAGAAPVPESVAAALRAIDGYLDDWITAVKAYALDLLQSGTPVPGYKLVAKRATRQWVDPAKAEEWLKRVAKLKVAELHPPSDLISPAQAEKYVGKGKLPEALYESKSSGTTIAPVSDSRPEVTPQAQQAGAEFF